jgi:hypothetical protein
LALTLHVHLREAAAPGPSGVAAALVPSGAATAISSAERLARDFPAFGHLTHVASHLFLRLGRWHDAVQVNLAALEADRADVERCLWAVRPHTLNPKPSGRCARTP